MKYSILLLALLASTAQATDKRKPQQPSNFLGQAQGQIQGQWQGQNANGGAGGSVSSVISTQYERFPVNTAFANPAHTTAPCKSGIGAGAQGSRFGISFGGTVDDKECDARQWAATWFALGQPEAAVEIACTSEMNKKLQICQPKPKQ